MLVWTHVILHSQELWAVVLLILESATYLRILCLDQALWSSEKSPRPYGEDLGSRLF